MTERSMEHWVLDDLGIKTEDLNNGEKKGFWIISQGKTEQREIKIILKKSGGKPKFSPLSEFKLNEKKSEGWPEYIFQHKNKKLILIVECKGDKNKHETLNKDRPYSHNVDGVLYYAKYFKEEFDVLCLAVSGVRQNKCKISLFNWKKSEEFPHEKENQEKILLVEEYFDIQKEEKQPIEYKKIREIARELNETFRSESWGLDDKQKPFFISACLLTLENKDFRKDFHQSEEQLKKKYKVNDLVSFCKSTIETEIKKLLVKEKKKSKYKSLRKNLLKVIDDTEKLTEIKNENETYFVSILRKIKQEVHPYIMEIKEDVIGVFYHEFLKYASSSDGKVLGITLTPSHIADLFCDLVLKILGRKDGGFSEEDKILDICCGTGTFLVSALKKGANKNNLYGIELNQSICDLALTNMILWRDGKSNIYRTNCFDEKKKGKEKIVEPIIKEAKCNVGFLNPPYSLKKNKKSEGKTEIEFIKHLCDLLVKDGVVIAIVPLSVATGNTDKEERREIMKYHTLEAVMTMPPDLFSANKSGSNTCIMVWRTGIPHDKQTPTWLANWKDDGFVSSKGKREPRMDGIWKKKDIWKGKEKEWLNMYRQNPIQCISTFQNLTAEKRWKSDKTKFNTCWLADAYVETDYSPLTKEGGEVHFEKTIRDYLAFLIANFHSPKQTQIGSLDISNWKDFYLNEKEGNFKIWRGKWKEALARTSPKILFDYDSVIPIVSSSQDNNGVDNFVKKSEREDIEPNSKNSITIANNGSVGEAFFQPLDFQATSDVTVLELVNQELNEYIAFFLCSIIKMKRRHYSWGRKWGLEEMRNTPIKLPWGKDGKPNWKFMEDYSKEIFFKIKESIYQVIETEREREREREREQKLIILLQNGKKLRLLIIFAFQEPRLPEEKTFFQESSFI